LPPQEPQIETAEDVLRVLNKLIDWLFTILLILSIMFVIFAGYKYLFAKGDPEKFKEANRMILYAVIAIAVGMIARGVEFIVKQLLGL